MGIYGLPPIRIKTGTVLNERLPRYWRVRIFLYLPTSFRRIKGKERRILAELSSNLLYIAFILYMISTFLFGGAIKTGKTSKWSKAAIITAIVGFVAQL